MKFEEQNRDASSKEDSSSDIGSELVVAINPNQYLFLELDRVLLAALGDVIVRYNAVFILDLEIELTDFCEWACHDDIFDLVEEKDEVVVAQTESLEFDFGGFKL